MKNSDEEQQQQHLLGCNLLGGLFLSDRYGGWEVWRLTPTRSGGGVTTIRSWTHDQKVLCSDADGKIYTRTQHKKNRAEPQQQQENDKNSSGRDDKYWSIEKHSERGVWIRSVAHDRLLFIDISSTSNGKHGCLATVAMDELDSIASYCWSLEPAHRHQFHVACQPGGGEDAALEQPRFLSCSRTTNAQNDPEEVILSTTAVLTDRKQQQATTTWMVEFVEPGFVVLKAIVNQKEKQNDDKTSTTICPAMTTELFS